MAARESRNEPTDRELEILSILWKNGPSSVQQVNDAINEHRPTGYTTTLKLMQIMTKKGLVARDKSQRQHIYRPVATEEKTQKRLLRSLLDKAFSGSAEKLVMHALASKEISTAELSHIKKVLEKMEGKIDR